MENTMVIDGKTKKEYTEGNTKHYETGGDRDAFFSR